MVPKQQTAGKFAQRSFRAVLFRMVPKLVESYRELSQVFQSCVVSNGSKTFFSFFFFFLSVLELCCFEWFQNVINLYLTDYRFQSCVVSNGSKTFFLSPFGLQVVLELCCFEWFQNLTCNVSVIVIVLELCCFEWFQNLL